MALLVITGAAAAWWFGVGKAEYEAKMEQADAAQKQKDLNSANTKADETERQRQTQIGKLLTDARLALASRNWSDAQDKFQAVLLLDPGQSEAKQSLDGVKEHLANARGGLIVKTDPPGATVMVGGEDVETTPATIKGLKPGKYPIKISLEGYEQVEKEAEVKENEFTELEPVTLQRSVGSLTLTTVPDAQDYELTDPDGKTLTGKTPPVLKISPPANTM